jgi:hypothetical protein
MARPDVPPPDIVLDDLAEPRLPEDLVAQSAALAELAAQVPLDPDGLMAHARSETGLDDFGEDDGFRERLEVVCRGIRDDVPLSPMGVLGSFGQLSAFLRNRLLVEDLVRRNPRILDIEVTAPIVIAGLPRSGTTHLHNLLGADPELRALPWWEALEPVLPDAQRPAPGEPDPRMARAAEGIAVRNHVLPHFDAMHEMTVDHVHEEIHLLAIDLSTMFFENLGTGMLPTWRDYYLAHDQRPHYRYLRRLLQVLQFARGGRRWVLKSPQHLEQLTTVFDVFPDATLVITHRDPVSTVASFATMITYSSRMAAAAVDPPLMGHYWADRIETLLRGCVAQRDQVPEAQVVDVLFHEYMGAEMEIVRQVYATAGQPLGEASLAAMDRYQEQHPRGRFGRVRYDLGVFGLDAGELRERFGFYTDRFPVALES